MNGSEWNRPNSFVQSEAREVPIGWVGMDGEICRYLHRKVS